MGEEHVREALRGEAADAPSADDLWARTTRRMRWRRLTRWGGGAAAAVVMLGGGALALDGLPVSTPMDVRLDASENTDAASGGTDSSDSAAEWQDVRIRGAVISVPAHWEVVEVDERAEPEIGDDPPSGQELEDRYEALEVECPLPEDRPVLVLRDQWGSCSGEDVLAAIEIDTRDGAVDSVIRKVLAPEGGATSDDRVASHETREIGGISMIVADSSEGEMLLATGLGTVIRTRPGDRDDEVEQVLQTLRPTGPVDQERVLTGRSWPEGPPDGSAPKTLELWAVTPDGRWHTWHRTEARTDLWGHEGLLGWPGTSPERFAARLRIDGEVRVAVGRPGEEGEEVYAFPTDKWIPDVDSWSPSGHGIVWFDRESSIPTAGIAVWEDVDAMVDGEPPVVDQEVTVEGAEHPKYGEGLGSLYWDEGDILRDDNRGFVAELERDRDGYPRLPDPLVFDRDDSASEPVD